MKMDPRSFAVALAVERGSVAVGPGVLAIPLIRGKRNTNIVSEFALISYEDRHLREYHWSISPTGYARRREIGTGRGFQMHREVMDMPRMEGKGITGDVVDHISRDKLDNRRENLRVCTQAQNAQNHSGHGGSSQYRGVSLNPKSGRWRSYVSLAGKMHWLGEYDTEEEARDVAAEWRRVHMPFSEEALADAA